MYANLKTMFGVDSVENGHRTVAINHEPQLIVSTTMGRFVITSPVSRALNLNVGDNVMFVSNFSKIEAAIQARVPDMVKYAEEQGIDIDSAEGQDQLFSTFKQWFIAKGVPKFNNRGEAVMVSDRATVDTKKKYLSEHTAELVAKHHDALVAKYGDLTDEELGDKLTPDMVEMPMYQQCTGSRTTSSGGLTGIGCQLAFTNTLMWKAFKEDMEESNTSIQNRIFNVGLGEGVACSFFNGYENVNITVYPIDFKEDVDANVRRRKATSTTETTSPVEENEPDTDFGQNDNWNPAWDESENEAEDAE
jgi:hypothetical protein